jgi:RNA polymerase sigma factor (sigma-70 family)
MIFLRAQTIVEHSRPEDVAATMDQILESSSLSESDPALARFELIVREFGPRLSRLAASYVDERADRDDLLQEILLALWRALPGFRGDSSLRTFIYRVAMNRATTFRARRYRRAEVATTAELRDPAPAPDARVEAADQHERLTQAIRALPPVLRDVALPYLEDLSIAEIAELQGITENNVRVRLTRARQQLRTFLPHMP